MLGGGDQHRLVFFFSSFLTPAKRERREMKGTAFYYSTWRHAGVAAARAVALASKGVAVFLFVL